MISFETFFAEVKTAAVDKFMLHKGLDPTLFILHGTKYRIIELPSLQNKSPLVFANQLLKVVRPDFWAVATVAYIKKLEKQENMDEYTKNYKWGDLAKEGIKDEVLFVMAKSRAGQRLHVGFEIQQEPLKLTEMEIDMVDSEHLPW